MKRVFDDLNIFCKVVETGSMKQAAESLSIPHSTVSRRIEALENALGLTLLHRTTREVKVSSRGQELYDDCAVQFDAIQRSISLAVDAEVEFKGKLSISMPVRAGIDFLGAWLIDFASLHPELQLDLAMSNSNKDLIKNEIDFAFRVGPLVDSSAIAQKLWDIPYTVCAHPTLMEKFGITDSKISMETLQSLPCVVARPALSWMFTNNNREDISIAVKQELMVDDLGLAHHAALGGQYAAMLPTSMLKNDKLIQLEVDGLKARTRVMYAYYLGRRHAQSQIKQLVNYIKQRNEALS
ncbi:transcriptional regulator LysR family [Vibrio maritimus]|uniref:Transcriptional regulator LysR family n=1 Tax=Vibrio maritimus TaxID=990268 RepID=A0A090RTH4_9VIBR|nr:transcriptional regulator LysR family [Vibrio maritimus]